MSFSRNRWIQIRDKFAFGKRLQAKAARATHLNRACGTLGENWDTRSCSTTMAMARLRIQRRAKREKRTPSPLMSFSIPPDLMATSRRGTIMCAVGSEAGRDLVCRSLWGRGLMKQVSYFSGNAGAWASTTALVED